MSRNALYQIFVGTDETEIPYISVEYDEPGVSVSSPPRAKLKAPFNRSVEHSSGSTVLLQDILDTLETVDIHKNGELVFAGEIVGLNRSLGADGIEIECELINKHYNSLRQQVCDAYPAVGNVGGRTATIHNPWNFSRNIIGIKYGALGITPQVNYNLGITPQDAVEHVIEKRLFQYLTPSDQWIFSPDADGNTRPQIVHYVPSDTDNVDNIEDEDSQLAFRFGAADTINLETIQLSHGSSYMSESFYGNCECEIQLYGFRTHNDRADFRNLDGSAFSVYVLDENDNWAQLSRDSSLDDWGTSPDADGFRSGWSGTVAINNRNARVRVEFDPSGVADFDATGQLDFADVFFTKINIENEDQHSLITPGTIEDYDANPPNLLKNGGFEFDRDGDGTPDNWVIVNDGPISSTSVDEGTLDITPDNFPGSWHFNVSGSSGTTESVTFKQTVNDVSGGISHSARVYFEHVNHAPEVELEVVTFNDSDTALDTFSDTSSTDKELTLSDMSFDANTDYCEFRFKINLNNESFDINFDGATLQATSTLNSFIGTVFGKNTTFNFNFYNQNRLKALESIRQASANDFEVANPYYDIWITPQGKLRFEKERGKVHDDVFSFSERNIISLDINRDDDIYNTVEALGAGSGSIQTRIVGSIKDHESIKKYGKREYTFHDSDIENLVTLESRAWSFLTRHSEPRMNVDVTFRPGFDQNLKTGDTIIVREPRYGIDQELRVKSLGWSFDDSGEEISSELFEAYPAVDSLFNQILDKTDGQRSRDTQKRLSSPTQGTPLRFSYDSVADESELGEYTFYIPNGNEIERILFFMRTAPFDTFSQGAAAGGGTSTSSESGSAHSHTISGKATETTTPSSVSSGDGGGAVVSDGSSFSQPETISNGSSHSNSFSIPNGDGNGYYAIVSYSLGLSSGLELGCFSEIQHPSLTNRAVHSQRTKTTGNTVEETIFIPSDFETETLYVEVWNYSGSSQDASITVRWFEILDHNHSVSGSNHGHAIDGVATENESEHTHEFEIQDHTHDLDHGIFKLEDGLGNPVFPMDVKAFLSADDAATDNYIDEVGLLNPSGQNRTIRQDESDDGDGTDHWKYHPDEMFAIDLTEYFRVGQEPQSPITTGSHTIHFGTNSQPDAVDNPKNLGKIYVNHLVIRKESE